MGTRIDHFAAVVPAGGAGTRLWPLSRAGSPKFLHDLTGTGRTLLQGTVDRLTNLAGSGVLVVTGQAHLAAVRAQLPGLPPADLLAEPSARDSMAAIGLAAAVLRRRDPDVVLGSFAADHVITEPDAFGAAVREAVTAAEAGYLVTIGITPSFAATGFGYIAPGEPLGNGTATAWMVRDFVEKPDAATARRYLHEGYLWNAGMFVAKAAVLLDHLATQQPALAAGLSEIADAIHDEPPAVAELAAARIWPGLRRISIDHAIAEPVAAAGGMAVVPGAFAWDDVGDWDSLANILPGDDAQVRVLGPADKALTEDASGVVVPGSGRVVAVLGLADVVVVDTEDAVLVTTRARAQEVKRLVDRLKEEHRSELT